MISTELIRPPRAIGRAEPSGDRRRDARAVSSTGPTFAEALDETLPLVDFVPVAGPPAVFLFGPLVLLALTLVGSFALLLTLVLAFLAVVAVVALIGVTLAAPYLAVRRLGKRWAHRGRPMASAMPVVTSSAARLRRVGA